MFTGSRLPKVKMFIENQLPEIKMYHRKSKVITGSRLPKVQKLIIFFMFLILCEIYVF